MAKAEITYESYSGNLSEGNRQTLVDLFTQARKLLPNHTVSMKYKFPILDEYGKFGFAERAGYISHYFHHDKLATTVNNYHDKLGSYKIENESLRYKKASDIPVAAILALIDELFNDRKSG